MKKILPFLLLALTFTCAHAQEAAKPQEQDPPCWQMYDRLETFHVYEKMYDRYICSYGSHTDKNMRKARALAYYDALKNLLPYNYDLIAERLSGDTTQIAFNSKYQLVTEDPSFDKCYSSYYTGPSLQVSNNGQCKFISTYVNELWIEFANERACILCDEVIETPGGYKATCMIEITKKGKGTIIEDFYDYCKRESAEWFK